jgi:DNA mismatch endonuclease, patch repair protein
MTDVFSRVKRSQIMARVRSQGNQATEVALLVLFRRHRITGWRRSAPIFGKPDFIFPKHRLAIFVDGCFWHGCPRHGSYPSSNKKFWQTKLDRNKVRDRFVTHTLRRHGWRVLRVWQHELSRNNEQRLIRRILSTILTKQREHVTAASISQSRLRGRTPH